MARASDTALIFTTDNICFMLWTLERLSINKPDPLSRPVNTAEMRAVRRGALTVAGQRAGNLHVGTRC